MLKLASENAFSCVILDHKWQGKIFVIAKIVVKCAENCLKKWQLLTTLYDPPSFLWMFSLLLKDLISDFFYANKQFTWAREIIHDHKIWIAKIFVAWFKSLRFLIIDFSSTLTSSKSFMTLVAEWPPVWERAVHSVFRNAFSKLPSIYVFSCFPFWFWGQDVGSDCISSWSLLIFLLWL